MQQHMGGPRILLAEHVVDDHRLIESALRASRPDADLTLVHTGDQLVKVVGHRHFDCVVLDYDLPDSRGDELLPLLAGRGCDCPVVVISGVREQDVAVQSIRLGGADFVTKEEAGRGTTLWKRIEVALDRKRKDVAEQKQIERRVKRLARLAETDPLTGLHNRLHLHRLMSGRRARFDRRGHVSCIMVDLDFFKTINDTLGHLCGDHVLRGVADTLKSCTRASDILCRWGGEEFLAVMPNKTLGAAWIYAEHLRQTIESTRLPWLDSSVAVTASLGVAQCRSIETWNELIARADEALYLAKTRGRNQVCGWPMVMLESLVMDDAVLATGNPERQLGLIVAKAGDLLGPTQREHLEHHSIHVAHLAELIGLELGLDSRELRQLRLAGTFHDLGKFVVPEDIMANPEPLSGPEQSLFLRHAEYGADIAVRLGLAPECLAYIRHHHDRFDRVKAAGESSTEGVPLGARIIAVANAYDAMTSWRAHRQPRSRREALAELARERGGQFDPRVVDAALAALGGRRSKRKCAAK